MKLYANGTTRPDDRPRSPTPVPSSALRIGAHGHRLLHRHHRRGQDLSSGSDPGRARRRSNVPANSREPQQPVGRARPRRQHRQRAEPTARATTATYVRGHARAGHWASTAAAITFNGTNYGSFTDPGMGGTSAPGSPSRPGSRLPSIQDVPFLGSNHARAVWPTDVHRRAWRLRERDVLDRLIGLQRRLDPSDRDLRQGPRQLRLYVNGVPSAPATHRQPRPPTRRRHQHRSRHRQQPGRLQRGQCRRDPRLPTRPQRGRGRTRVEPVGIPDTPAAPTPTSSSATAATPTTSPAASTRQRPTRACSPIPRSPSTTAPARCPTSSAPDDHHASPPMRRSPTPPRPSSEPGVVERHVAKCARRCLQRQRAHRHAGSVAARKPTGDHLERRVGQGPARRHLHRQDDRRTISAAATARATSTFTIAGAADPETSYATSVRSDNPLAYWRLGETSGTTAADDLTAHPATYGGSPTLGGTGALVADTNKAPTLDGVNDRVDAPNTVGLLRSRHRQLQHRGLGQDHRQRQQDHRQQGHHLAAGGHQRRRPRRHRRGSPMTTAPSPPTAPGASMTATGTTSSLSPTATATRRVYVDGHRARRRDLRHHRADRHQPRPHRRGRHDRRLLHRPDRRGRPLQHRADSLAGPRPLPPRRPTRQHRT